MRAYAVLMALTATWAYIDTMSRLTLQPQQVLCIFSAICCSRVSFATSGLLPGSNICCVCRNLCQELEATFEAAWVAVGLSLDGPTNPVNIHSRASDPLSAAATYAPRAAHMGMASAPLSPSASMHRRKSQHDQALPNIHPQQAAGLQQHGGQQSMRLMSGNPLGEQRTVAIGVLLFDI